MEYNITFIQSLRITLQQKLILKLYLWQLQALVESFLQRPDPDTLAFAKAKHCTW